MHKLHDLKQPERPLKGSKQLGRMLQPSSSLRELSQYRQRHAERYAARFGRLDLVPHNLPKATVGRRVEAGTIQDRHTCCARAHAFRHSGGTHLAGACKGRSCRRAHTWVVLVLGFLGAHYIRCFCSRSEGACGPASRCHAYLALPGCPARMRRRGVLRGAHYVAGFGCVWAAVLVVGPISITYRASCGFSWLV